jgi:hypothetical protein
VEKLPLVTIVEGAGMAPKRSSTSLKTLLRCAGLLGLLLLACAATLLAASCGSTTSTSPAVIRVLFIGNSYTFYNGGIDAQLHGLAPSTRTEAIVAGGYTLENHWDSGRTLAEIRKGGWHYVVLQEQSQTPVLGPLKFDQYVRGFDQEIRRVGAKTVLLMTWERPDSVAVGVTTANLAAAYTTIGTEVGAIVAPAGLAFAAAKEERPDISLTLQDGHPTMQGTYLAACVLYGVLFHRSPVGNSFGSLPADQKAFLQRVAADTLGL